VKKTTATLPNHGVIQLFEVHALGSEAHNGGERSGRGKGRIRAMQKQAKAGAGFCGFLFLVCVHAQAAPFGRAPDPLFLTHSLLLLIKLFSSRLSPPLAKLGEQV